MRFFTSFVFGLVVAFSQAGCTYLTLTLHDMTPKVPISQLSYLDRVNSSKLRQILLEVTDDIKDSIPYTADNKVYILDVEFNPETNTLTYHVSMPDDDNSFKEEDISKSIDDPKYRQYLLDKLTEPMCDDRPLSKIVRTLLVKEGGTVRFSLYYKNEHKTDFDITKNAYCPKK